MKVTTTVPFQVKAKDGTNGTNGSDGYTPKHIVCDTDLREYPEEIWNGWVAYNFTGTWSGIGNISEINVGDIAIIRGVITDKGRASCEYWGEVLAKDNSAQVLRLRYVSFNKSGQDGSNGIGSYEFALANQNANIGLVKDSNVYLPAVNYNVAETSAYVAAGAEQAASLTKLQLYDGSTKIAESTASIAGKAKTRLRSFTRARWNLYGAAGHNENWTACENYADYNTGDPFVIEGVISDDNDKPVYIYATVAEKPTSTTVKATSIGVVEGYAGTGYTALIWRDCIRITYSTTQPRDAGGHKNFTVRGTLHVNDGGGERDTQTDKTFSNTFLTPGNDGTSPVIYDLAPNETSLVKHSNGTFTPSTLQCSVRICQGDGTTLISDPAQLPSGIKVVGVYGTSQGATAVTFTNASGASAMAITPSSSTASVHWELIKNSTLIDKQDVSIVSDGSPAKKTYCHTVKLYQRSPSKPSAPGNTLYYFFTNHADTSLFYEGHLRDNDNTSAVLGSNFGGVIGNWHLSVPDGTAQCWETTAVATATEADAGADDTCDEIMSAEWSTVSSYVKDGTDGEPGEDGVNAFTVQLGQPACVLTTTTTDGNNYYLGSNATYRTYATTVEAIGVDTLHISSIAVYDAGDGTTLTIENKDAYGIESLTVGGSGAKRTFSIVFSAGKDRGKNTSLSLRLAVTVRQTLQSGSTRQTTVDLYATITFQADGANGPKGAIIRVQEWEKVKDYIIANGSYTFQGGNEDGAQYDDILLMGFDSNKPTYLHCIKGYTLQRSGSAGSYTVTEPAASSENWEGNFFTGFVATNLLLAQRALIKNLQAEGFRLMNGTDVVAQAWVNDSGVSEVLFNKGTFNDVEVTGTVHATDGDFSGLLKAARVEGVFRSQPIEITDANMDNYKFTESEVLANQSAKNNIDVSKLSPFVIVSGNNTKKIMLRSFIDWSARYIVDGQEPGTYDNWDNDEAQIARSLVGQKIIIYNNMTNGVVTLLGCVLFDNTLSTSGATVGACNCVCLECKLGNYSTGNSDSVYWEYLWTKRFK